MSVDAESENDIPAGFRIPDHRDVIKGELVQSYWIVANIQTNGAWPIVAQKVRWRGVDIWIMPIMKGFYPAVGTSLSTIPAQPSRLIASTRSNAFGMITSATASSRSSTPIPMN